MLRSYSLFIQSSNDLSRRSVMDRQNMFLQNTFTCKLFVTENTRNFDVFIDRLIRSCLGSQGNAAVRS